MRLTDRFRPGRRIYAENALEQAKNRMEMHKE
ncbi:hypothetical protein Y888_18335 [Mixta calida B021323]|nr:hypothetical protein Y888_18335 [Mixta calida B021323]